MEQGHGDEQTWGRFFYALVQRYAHTVNLVAYPAQSFPNGIQPLAHGIAHDMNGTTQDRVLNPVLAGTCAGLRRSRMV